MTERERWIVYPLIFLAISISLKSKFIPTPQKKSQKTLEVDQLNAKQITTSLILGERASFNELNAPLIHAQQIQVEDGQNIPKIIMRSLSLSDANQGSEQKTTGMIDVLGTENQGLVTLGGHPGGGFVITRATEDKNDFVAFGYDQRGSGLFWLDKQGQPKGFFRRKVERVPPNPPAGNAEDGEDKPAGKAATPTGEKQDSLQQGATPLEDKAPAQ